MRRIAAALVTAVLGVLLLTTPVLALDEAVAATEETEEQHEGESGVIPEPEENQWTGLYLAAILGTAFGLIMFLDAGWDPSLNEDAHH